MRIVKVGVLAPTNKGIQLGAQGENRATEVEFDTRPWFREYPSGTVSAVARRYGDPAPYPLSLDVADGTSVWQVSDTDTAKPGVGAVELTMTSGGTRVRSLTFKTLVTASLTDSPIDDDAWYGWLDKAVVKVDETVQSAQRKMDEVDEEWTGLKADVTEKVDECGEAASQAASDAHHAKVDAQVTAKALESAEGSVAKAEAAASRAVDASLAADDSAVEASRSALSAVESAEAAAGSASSAADAASAAFGSASAAEQSATDASNAKVAAQTAKAEAATSASNAATSASNAESSATAAAKSASDAAASVGEMLNEAKKYTDANTSNALVGTVSGKLMHVEDAWPSNPPGLTIEGACKQDGTPSPENPAPITVVENPTLKVTGKNLWDKGIVVYNYSIDYLKYNPNASVTLEPGTYTISSDGRLPNLQFFEPGSHKQLTCAEATDMDGANIKYAVVWGGYAIEPPNDNFRLITITLTRAVEMTGCVINSQGTWIQVEPGTNATAYAPYVGASLPITLPAEHTYLAALPDGTHDEIVIDKDGNVSLVARVLRVIVPKTNWIIQGQNGGFSLGYTSVPSGSNDVKKGLYATSIMSDRLESRHDWVNAPCFGISEVLWIVPRTNQNDITSDDAAAVATGMIFYAPLATPVTYQLGKLDIPSLPESISNVWTDAELTTNMSMTYKRDINIAFGNLVQAVVAAAAGE